MNIAQGSGGGGSALGLLIPMLLIFAVFYFLILRPARNRQRQALVVQRSLAPGSEVMTTAGLFGTVSAVEDDVVVLEIAPGVNCRYAKQAVLRVITPSPTTSTEETQPDT